MSFKSFQSKVLLFGEYAAIHKGKALTIPYGRFAGQLVLPHHCVESDKDSQSHREIKAFGHYLMEYCGDFLDLAALKNDIDRGLYFDSSIPQGFGLGSSGALCAALYDRYRKVKEELPPKDLKHIFILMESHFHGLSSGIDPLISYLGTPLLFESDDRISPVEIFSERPGPGALFLVNTGQTRRTGALVNLFLEKCKSSSFESFFKEKIIPVTDRSIRSFLAKENESFWENFMELSAYQFECFGPMIPRLLGPLWRRGLDEGHFALKLCGAGGGGVFLGAARDFQRARKRFYEYEIRPICFF
ncbi:MAG: mevalonate kinase [Bacteriovoracales bacterium]|nr:mevalonate kinase [Bacteriovoracales bacterium]